MAAHFTREDRPGFFHFRFDQRVSGLPHNGRSAVFLYVVKKRLRAFYFSDDRRARPFRQDRTRKQDHQLIAPNNSPRFINNADAVAVAIECDADVSVVFTYGVDQVYQVVGHGRVRMMVRKTWIRFDEKLYHLNAEVLE